MHRESDIFCGSSELQELQQLVVYNCHLPTSNQDHSSYPHFLIQYCCFCSVRPAGLVGVSFTFGSRVACKRFARFEVDKRSSFLKKIIEQRQHPVYPSTVC